MKINNYHFHLYYPLEEAEIAKATKILNKLAQQRPGQAIGRIWDKPVGPHPIGSCQVTVERKDFSELMEWFMVNREDLSLFIHPDTGDDLADHTQHTIWLGHEFELKTDQFRK